MKNMKTICAIRDVFRAMSDFENKFEQVYQITLNEAMILCAINCFSGKMTATNLSKQTNFTPSHTSKILRILEEKKLIIRTHDTKDRRLMHFTLSALGKERICDMEMQKVEIPELFKPLFKGAES